MLRRFYRTLQLASLASNSNKLRLGADKLAGSILQPRILEKKNYFLTKAILGNCLSGRAQVVDQQVHAGANSLDFSKITSPCFWGGGELQKGLLCSSLSSVGCVHAIFLSNAQPHVGHVTCRPTAVILAVQPLSQPRR